jgi:hypothetical protein
MVVQFVGGNGGGIGTIVHLGGGLAHANVNQIGKVVGAKQLVEVKAPNVAQNSVGESVVDAILWNDGIFFGTGRLEENKNINYLLPCSPLLFLASNVLPFSLLRNFHLQ